MRYYILVITISLIGFFVNIEFLGQTGNILVKTVLFFGLGYTVYKHYTEFELFSNKHQDSNENSNQDLPTNNTLKKIELSTNEIGNLNQILSDKNISLNSFLISQFDVLYNFFLPNNGYIFVENNESDTRLFYKNIKTGIAWTDSVEFPNILKLLKNHTTEILVENNLKADSKILPYYDSKNYSPGSVLSFSTSITDGQKIYWVFDTQANGYFNEVEFKFLTRVSFVVHYVVTNAFKQKHLTNQLLKEKKKLELTSRLNSCATKDELTSAFIEHLAGLYEAHKLTIAMIDPNNTQMASIIKTIGQVDSIKAGMRFRLDEGLCGKVLSNQQIYLIDDIEKDGYFIPRFSKNEKTNFGLRSFLALPLLSNSTTIGLVLLEHKNPGAFTSEHKLELKEFCEYYSRALDRFVGNEYIDELKEETPI